MKFYSVKKKLEIYLIVNIKSYVTRFKCSLVMITLLSSSTFNRGSLRKRFFANTSSLTLNFVVKNVLIGKKIQM